MRQRTLALVTLLAALAIVALFRLDRPRDVEPKGAPSPEERDAAEPVDELSYAEPARVGRAEAPAAESNGESKARNGPRARLRVVAKPEPLPRDDATMDTVLVFRALDGAGQAVRGDLSVATRIFSPRGYRRPVETVTTDAEGRFEVRVERSLPEGERRELEVSEQHRGQKARVDVTGPFPPGRTDLGDLRLSPEPLIAEGKVIDASGRPVVNASVHVQAVKAGRYEATGDFEPVSFDGEETTEDGRFAAYGSTSAAQMNVFLHHERLKAPPLQLPVGTRGIEIVAQESGGIAGQVLVDPGVQATGLTLGLLPNTPTTSKEKEIADDGHFQLNGLPPGTYTLSVMAYEDVLVEIPGIEVAPGEITQDPRLAALDLRGRLHVFTLDLVPPSPSFEISGIVFFNEVGTSSPVLRKYFQESPVVVVTPLPAIDVRVRARNCRLERFSALSESTEVRLRPCLTVRLVLPRDIVLPPPPLFLGAGLEPEGHGPKEWMSTASQFSAIPRFDERGEALCQAQESGRHFVRWFVERRYGDSGGSSKGILGMTIEQVVVVEDRAGEQRIELVLTNAALTAALATR
jgi:hypothetical protein